MREYLTEVGSDLGVLGEGELVGYLWREEICALLIERDDGVYVLDMVSWPREMIIRAHAAVCIEW